MKKIGVYAGSFNPFHVGHLDIYRKAQKLFDDVILAVGINPDKYDHNLLVRITEISKKFPEMTIDTFYGMLIPYLVSLKEDVTLIRGLRNGFDFNYEQTQLRFLEDMCPEGFELKVIYIPCDKKYEHISSSAIRGIDLIDARFSERYKI